MSGKGQSSSSSRPQPVPWARSSDGARGRSPPPAATSKLRAESMARLASPVPSVNNQGGNQTSQVSSQSPRPSGRHSPLPGASGVGSLQGPGHSALAAAFQGSLASSPPRLGTPPVRLPSPSASRLESSVPPTTYGSFESRSGMEGHRRDSSTPIENPKVVKRHLVKPSRESLANSARPSPRESSSKAEARLDDDEFSSLKVQGGDITREVYKWARDTEIPTQGRRGKRSQSWDALRPEPESETTDFQSITIPGGFRRDFMRRQPPSPSVRSDQVPEDGPTSDFSRNPNPRNFISRNFLEYLTIYGHFAGEDLEDEDEDNFSDPIASSGTGNLPEDSAEDEGEPGESSQLISPARPKRQRRKTKERGTPGTGTPMGAAGLLLKSFVGTGVLFLPRAFLNGGMMFSATVLISVAGLSWYCFVLLVRSRLKIVGSFADIGGVTYGNWLRLLIHCSVALSQIGFVSAYIVFTAENLQAFVLAITKCRTWIDIKYIVLLQVAIFLPYSMIRDISKLGITAYIADAFILLGLLYLGYFDIRTIAAKHGVSDIVSFNSQSWPLFIGTAIFTFEGVGLILPIQGSMKDPTKFPRVLAGVMIIIAVVFVSIGALSYAAFGSRTKTVVLLNLPQDDILVNVVQLLYCTAILLSTPLQLFPAIRILEGELFSKSGKYSRGIKWKKNVFRFFLVICCGLIAWGGAGDLEKFVSLVGSFACVPLVYVYPALLHLRAVAETRAQRTVDIALCGFGIIAMLYTTTQTLRSWTASPSQIKSPEHCDL
ncbi:uncharacterized protein KY384_009133 [Bacidia gigantensis]|uniref:uncharacterized protein n=1 Tax=Bacidia gigantensis TaxID=2732470 RepID=UPI001D04BD88|nr:uncharacterized protein KY384_009133 [Bacidia gigantensis]KAG8525489.1 hypothetical protein KY384_009133 [Bacidia gigantensis]